MAYVYRHIRLDKNEPFYIGVGSSANYRRAYSLENRNKHWSNIVNTTKYEVEILFDNLSDDEARSKEIEFISLYGRVDQKTGTLVNLTDGGDGCLSRVMSKETANKIGKANKGRKYSEEHKKRLSEYHKNRLLNPEEYKKHCEATKNNKIKYINIPDKKPVIQYDLHGNFIMEYNSLQEADIASGKSYSICGGISKCCNGKSKTCNGYIWKFKKK